MTDIERIKSEFPKIIKVLEKYHKKVDRSLEIPLEEYNRRQKAVIQALEKEGFLVGIVFSDEHYCGDVPKFVAISATTAVWSLTVRLIFMKRRTPSNSQY